MTDNFNDPIDAPLGARAFPVELPTPAEKERSINAILAAALPAPRRLRSDLPALLRSLGLRGLFFGVEDCAFLALLLSAALWGLLRALTLDIAPDALMELAPLFFFASPFLYGALHLLTVWKELLAGMYEQKSVCRYSLRQLTALRMLVFGAGNVLLLVPLSVAVSVLSGAAFSPLRLLGIAFAALFLYAALSLAADNALRPPLAMALPPVLWCVAGVALLLFGPAAIAALNALPTALFWLLAAGGAGVYFPLLRHYCFTPKEGALAHGKF